MVPWPMKQKRYPSDVTDDEWELLVTYLTLMTEDAPQRLHSLREVFNGLRWIIKTGAPWRYMPSDLPPWHVVYQQSRRWIKAGILDRKSTRLNSSHQIISYAVFCLKKKKKRQKKTKMIKERRKR